MILAYHAIKEGTHVHLSCSDGRDLVTEDWNEISCFLLMSCDMAVVFHIDKFVEAILSEDIKQTLDENHTYYTSDRRKLYYQLGRMFGINYINFYGLSRYSDKEIDNVDDLIVLKDKVMAAYALFGIVPDKLTSPVAAYSQVLDKLDFPVACDLPGSALPMLDKCAEVAWKEWREVYKLGHWDADNVTDYDLTSAYPYLISLLPDLRQARFTQSKTLLPKQWGLLYGHLNLTKDVTPFLKIGQWDDLITTDQLWLINKYGYGSFEMQEGWFYSLPSKYNQPFKSTMESLYKLRQHDNPLVNKIAKAISVGIGGKFAQRYDDGNLGEYYNSIYACMITSRCQVKVADFIWRNGIPDNVISVMVDGCLVEGERLTIPNVKGMGEWRANEPTPFLVASLLYQWGADKKPDSHIYSEIIEMINKSPKSSIVGDIDLNLLEYDRHFKSLPKSGKDLLNNVYKSEPSYT